MQNAKCKGKIVLFMFIVIMIISYSTYSLAMSDDSLCHKSIDNMICDTLDNLGEVLISNSDYAEYSIKDPEVIKKEIEKDGIILPEDKEVREIITVVANIENECVELQSDVYYTRWGTVYIDNVVDRGNLHYFPNDVLHTTSGGPGGEISQTVTESIQAHYSASYSVTNQMVTAAVGYNVTHSFSIADSYTKNLGPDEIGMIKSWVYYNRKDFEIFGNFSMPGIKLGEGSAYKPNGVRFRFYLLS